MWQKKVLIIGGTGIAGMAILNVLSEYRTLCSLSIAARNYSSEFGNVANFIQLDIFDSLALEKIIKSFDIVVIAAGPFHKINLDIYRICLESKIVCIDINDNILHYERLMNFKKEFINPYHGTILSGMGLCPGLTTFMLEFLAEQLEGFATEAYSRIFFGAGVVSGKASIDNFFESFSRDALVLSDGCIKKSSSRHFHQKNFSFDASHEDLPLLFFTSSEVLSLPQALSFKQLKTFDSAFCLQGFPKGLLPLLRHSSFARRILCQITKNNQHKLTESSKKERMVIVNLTVRNERYQKNCILRSDSSFRLTGIFCAAMVLSVINGWVRLTPGVFSFEHLEKKMLPIYDFLCDHGLEIFMENKHEK